MPDIDLDPSGKGQHESGSKLDAGKNRLGLVLGAFAPALEQVGRVGTFGANKYTDDGWLDVENGVERYTDAMLRHLLSDLQDQRVDEDSGLDHAAQVAWNALARYTLMLRDRTNLEPTDKPRGMNDLDTAFERLNFSGWISHDGGKSPVSKNEMVIVRDRGGLLPSLPILAEAVCWQNVEKYKKAID